MGSRQYQDGGERPVGARKTSTVGRNARKKLVQFLRCEKKIDGDAVEVVCVVEIRRFHIRHLIGEEKTVVEVHHFVCP